MKPTRPILAAIVASAALFLGATPVNAQVKPGDFITPENSSKIANLVSPGNYLLVRQGMELRITASTHLDWPPPYKAATERYSSQVRLDPDGQMLGYRAGLPFPMVDVNDPQAATKIVWNFELRPLYTDDLDARHVEVVTHRPGHDGAVEVMSFGHFGYYRSIGRTEVAPTPIDPDLLKTGIAYRSGIFPVLEPAEMRGAGIVREGSVLPGVEDAVWEWSHETRRLRRLEAAELSDAFGVSNGGGGSSYGTNAGVTTYASTIDPDSAYGFAAKPAAYDYRLLGERAMLASVDAVNSPAQPCARDGGRTVCPENWQMRNLFVVEATVKPRSVFGGNVIIPRRVLYIDSEGWFITASDLFNPEGELWKTIVSFHAYRDRPVEHARVAVWPFERMFQTALVDEDVTSGVSSVAYSPRRSGEGECWYINTGLVDKAFFTPAMLERSH